MASVKEWRPGDQPLIRCSFSPSCSLIAASNSAGAATGDQTTEAMLSLSDELSRLGYRMGRTFSLLGLLEAAVQAMRRVQVSR